MGQQSSKTAPEHVQRIEEDRHSAWGSDIDESWCGPGTICADEWTPMHSLAPTPESQRRRLSDIRIQDDEIITEQPGFSEDYTMEDDNVTNYDVMTMHDPEDFQVPTILVTPVQMKSKRKKKRKLTKRPRTRGLKRRKDVKSVRRQSVRSIGLVETPVLRKIHHTRKHRPKHHMIYVRRIRVPRDPRYPAIPPPQINSNLKFRRSHPEDAQNRFSKAVPPRHLKGQSVSARPHFRYRGIPKVIG